MRTSPRTRRLIRRGEIPSIACFNQSTIPLGSSFEALLTALQVYVERQVAPAWGKRAKLVRTSGHVPGHWALAFLDDSDRADALAIHDLTPDGLPLAKVFVRTALEAGQPVSVAASHELVEMLVDPGLNLLSSGPTPGAAYAVEVADPVQALNFHVRGLPMSDFVYPAYYEAFRPARSVPFDQMRRVTTPFEIMPGGYQAVISNGEWSQIYSAADATRPAPITSRAESRVAAGRLAVASGAYR